MTALLLVLLCAALNRMRGDDRWMPSWLPGRSLYYVAPVIGAAALLIVPWPAALAVAVAYFFWAVWPWGRWFDLGRLPAPIAPTGDDFEIFIERIAGGNDHLALLMRHMMAVPGILLIGCFVPAWSLGLTFGLALLVPVAITAAYELAWRAQPSNPIWLAELAAGVIWAGVILA